MVGEAKLIPSVMHGSEPTPVKRDMLRFLENQGQTLRYQAVFTNPKTPADASEVSYLHTT